MSKALAVGWPTTLLALTLGSSCGASPTARVVRVAISSPWKAGTHVIYGRVWALAGDVATNGNDAEVPQWANAVSAYVDTNGNGKFDRFAEPSGVCERTAEQWDCKILARRSTLQRTLSKRQDEEQHDNTYVFWEDYGPTGRRLDATELCLDASCTTLATSPFLSETDAQIHQLSVCGHEGFAPRDAVVRDSAGSAGANVSVLGASPTAQVVPDHGLNELVKIHLEQPPAFDALIHAGRGSGQLVVQVGDPGVNRALLWCGITDRESVLQRVYWNSEDARVTYTKNEHGAEFGVPWEMVSECVTNPKAVVAIQLLKFWPVQVAGLVSTTEVRQTIDVRPLLE